MSESLYDYGHEVRVIRNIRNDGTFPGTKVGDLLIRRGSVGYVISHGTFLQDQIIYEVHFLEQDRLVGCRAEELIDADAEWIESRFEFREKVKAAKAMVRDGETVVPVGEVGEILKVLRNNDYGDEVFYHVRYPGHTYVIPESALEPYVDPLHGQNIEHEEARDECK